MPQTDPVRLADLTTMRVGGPAQRYLEASTTDELVDAVREGRRIFDNIKKFLRFLLSSNMGEVLTVFGGVVLGHHQQDQAAGFGPRGHVERGGIQRRRRRATGGGPHVEPQGEHETLTRRGQ